MDSSCSRATFLLKVGQYWTSMEMPEVDSSCSRATFLLKVGQYWTSMEMPEVDSSCSRATFQNDDQIYELMKNFDFTVIVH